MHCTVWKNILTLYKRDERNIFDTLCILNSELFIEIINDVKLQKDITELYSVNSAGVLVYSKNTTSKKK